MGQYRGLCGADTENGDWYICRHFEQPVLADQHPGPLLLQHRQRRRRTHRTGYVQWHHDRLGVGVRGWGLGVGGWGLGVGGWGLALALALAVALHLQLRRHTHRTGHMQGHHEGLGLGVGGFMLGFVRVKLAAKASYLSYRACPVTPLWLERAWGTATAFRGHSQCSS